MNNGNAKGARRPRGRTRRTLLRSASGAAGAGLLLAACGGQAGVGGADRRR